MAEKAQPGRGKEAAEAEGCSAAGTPWEQGNPDWQIDTKWTGE